MQRVPWDNITELLDGVWHFLDIICDFTVECGMNGLMIYTAYIPLEYCERIDKITMGYTNISTQNRCLTENSICKAIDITYIDVFKKKMDGRGRLAHVSMEKMPQRLVNMCKHGFMWLGCGDTICFYQIPICFNPQIPDLDSGESSLLYHIPQDE
jgi:hypothetical protein